MDFKDYAQFLKPYIGSAKNDADYCAEIFANFIEDSAIDGFALFRYKTNTLSKYVNGSSKISKKNASYAFAKSDKNKYKNWIDDKIYESESSDKINEWLKKNGKPGEHESFECFELLKDILENISSSKKIKNPVPQPSTGDYESKVSVKNDKIIIEKPKFPLPVAKLPPDKIPLSELKLKYLHSLMEAYNDAEKTNFSLNDFISLKGKYKDNFHEQRVNFYEADCLKTFSRDCMLCDSDEFEKLLEETYDGVINTSRRSHLNGYERLLAVLEQATHIELNKSKIYHIEGLINNKKRLGLCHMLVNENKLDWVEKNDD